ncbi:protein timeless-like isoform X2 [Ostrea edulis]|uniref:protein timeless-like isoform X2 n=1 Tax=Ostrea edulis TaxID=37623 RepID=UPI0024AED248|nr:protein timeless-like isoform X2 [Ostrea edulis]XP_056005860.1 protein timeless-like isoform X2 [Ostrea edulis]
MEWHIMNAGGVSSLGSNLGSVEESQYVPSDDCKDVLLEILAQLKDEDPQHRTTRRQLHYSHLVEKDLCAMIKYLKDEPEIFSLVVRILANLTQPVESLVQSSGYSMTEATQTTLSWQNGVESSLHHYRSLLVERCILLSILEEIHTLVEECEGYPLLEENCETINQSLLLLRNLLHFPSSDEDNSSKEHEKFLRLLFECDFTERLMELLQLPQTEYWTVTVVQLVTLLFKGHVGEMFLHNVTDSDSVSSVPEKLEDFQECLICGDQHSDKELMCINHLEEGFSKTLHLHRDSSRNSSESGSTADLTDEEKLLKHLTAFAQELLKKAFCSLVHNLRHILTSPYKAMIDEVYLLWLVAFFLKYARHQRMEFEYIRAIYSTDMYGYLVYEGVTNSEQLVIAQRNKQDTTKYLRRLHLTVGALREMLHGLKLYSEDTNLSMTNTSYLQNLQRDLAGMMDLPQMLLLLIRNFQMHTHNLKFLQDVIVTNHLLLLLMDLWKTKGFSKREFNMLDHVKQFATIDVMQRYGRLLENYGYNNPVVNNCIFTMMHHIAGDCEKPTVLLQVQILRTFLEILDSSIPLSQEKNDLIEFILQKFMVEAEHNPFTCALQLFGEMPVKGEEGKLEEDQDEENIEEEVEEDAEEMKKEKDILLMLYTELMGQPGVMGAISNKLEEFGIKKSEKQISEDLKELDWLTDEGNEESEGDVSLEESDMDDSPPMSVPKQDDLSDSEVITHCVKKLRESNNDVHLRWLQRQFCEAAYAKFALSMSSLDKIETEEPVARYHAIQNKSFPIVLYNEEQEELMHNPYFETLLQFLGLHMPEDVGLVFPRIPHFWTIQNLVEKASQIGDLTEEQLKFDPVKLKEEREMTEIPYQFKIEGKDDITFEKLRKIPDSVWMNMIEHYNRNAGKETNGEILNKNMDSFSESRHQIVPF